MRRLRCGALLEALSLRRGVRFLLRVRNGSAACAIAAVLCTGARAPALDYHFSADGSDATGDGSRGAPWRTVARLNTLDLDAGDRVLFRAGDTFAGPIVLNAGDSATDADGVLRGAPIRLLSYGGRDRAVISSPHGHGLHAVDVGGLWIRNLEFAGRDGADEIADPANATTGLLFENTRGNIRQQHIVVTGAVVRGFGEAGIDFRAVNPATRSGGFEDVRVFGCVVHANGRSGITSSVRSDGGYVTDGPLYDFQSRAHANVSVARNRVRHTTGKRESGGVSGSGIVLAQVDTARIASNVAHHNGGVAGGGGVGIWTWESDRVVIQFNEAYANDSFDGRDGGGFDLDGGARQGLLQYNYSHGNHGAAIGLFQFGWASPMEGNVIRYNVSEDDGGGVAVWGSGPRFDGTGRVDAAAASLIYNNTVVHPRGAGASFFGSVAEVGVYNSIFLTSHGRPLVERDDYDGPGGSYTLDFAMLGNAYWSGSDPFLVAWEGAEYRSLAQWSAATRQELIGEVLVGVQSDPGLSGPFTGGPTLNDPALRPTLQAYRLRPASVLIDAGVAVGGLPLPIALGLTDIGERDFYRGSPGRWAAPDIGAHEFSPQQIPTPVPPARQRDCPGRPGGADDRGCSHSWRRSPPR